MVCKCVLPLFTFPYSSFWEGNHTPALCMAVQQTELHFSWLSAKSATVWKLVQAPVASGCQLSFHPQEDFCLTHPKGWIDIHRSSRGRNIWRLHRDKLRALNCQSVRVSLSWENLAANKPSYSPSSPCKLSAAKYSFSTAQASEQPTAPAYYGEVVASAYFRCRQFPLKRPTRSSLELGKIGWP